MKKGRKVAYKLEDIYGMIILLAIGLGAAMLVLFGELIFYSTIHQKTSSATRLHARERTNKRTQAWPDTKTNI